MKLALSVGITLPSKELKPEDIKKYEIKGKHSSFSSKIETKEQKIFKEKLSTRTKEKKLADIIIKTKK